jgi:hypothetical protein
MKLGFALVGLALIVAAGVAAQQTPVPTPAPGFTNVVVANQPHVVVANQPGVAVTNTPTVRPDPDSKWAVTWPAGTSVTAVSRPPEFLKVGETFVFTWAGGRTDYRLVSLGPDGWVSAVEPRGTGRRVWINTTLVAAIEPAQP